MDAASDWRAPRGAARSVHRSRAGRAGMRARRTLASAPALAKQQVSPQCAIERLVCGDEQLVRADAGCRLAQRGQVSAETLAVLTREIFRRYVERAMSLDV